VPGTAAARPALLLSDTRAFNPSAPQPAPLTLRCAPPRACRLHEPDNKPTQRSERMEHRRMPNQPPAPRCHRVAPRPLLEPCSRLGGGPHGMLREEPSASCSWTHRRSPRRGCWPRHGKGRAATCKPGSAVAGVVGVAHSCLRRRASGSGERGLKAAPPVGQGLHEGGAARSRGRGIGVCRES